MARLPQKKQESYLCLISEDFAYLYRDSLILSSRGHFTYSKILLNYTVVMAGMKYY